MTLSTESADLNPQKNCLIYFLINRTNVYAGTTVVYAVS